MVIIMDRLNNFNKLIEKISAETRVPIPEGYKYRYAFRSCWKCDKEMITFKWRHSLMEGPIDKPPEPIPPTLKKRYTLASNETYWANVCPNCDSVQGDFFINEEPDSPLFILDEVINNKKNFDKDMKKMADYYYDYCI